MFINHLGKKNRVKFQDHPSKKFRIAETQDFFLVKNLTFMNTAGEIMNPLMKYLGYKKLKKGILETGSGDKLGKEFWADNMIVCVDHLDTNVGKCRIKMGGSAK